MGRDVTPRMVEVVAAHVAAGTYKGAGQALGISPFTVRDALGDVRERLGVETTEQAVYILTARGVLVVPGVGRRAA